MEFLKNAFLKDKACVCIYLILGCIITVPSNHFCELFFLFLFINYVLKNVVLLSGKFRRYPCIPFSVCGFSEGGRTHA